MIPPLVSFNSYEAFEDAISVFYAALPKHERSMLEQVLSEARSLMERGYAPTPNPTILAIILGISPRLVSSMALRPKRYWRIFELPKRSGGVRQITAPRVFLKTIQLYLLQHALSRISISTHAYGFSAGRSIFANASLHVAKRYVYNTDIKDFFPSIKHASVRTVFQQMGYAKNMSAVLASLCTFQGVLPQGAPTSPALSNIVFHSTDTSLASAATEFGMTYSRYADDLTFSSDEKPHPAFLSTIDELLKSAGFSQNLEKIRLQGPGQGRYVTGLLVNERVHPARSTRRRLRAVFHRLEQDGITSGMDVNTVRGWAAYVNAYNPALGREYLDQVGNAAEKDAQQKGK